MKSTMLFIALFLSAFTFFAQNAPRRLQVLTPQQTDPGRLLPPPPMDGSERQRRELAEVERLVKTRTPERFAQAAWDNEHEDPSAFASVMGAGFDLSNLPATAKLLHAVVNDQSVVASAAKEYFHRRSPVAVSAGGAASYREWTCDKNPRAPAERPLRSYPSAHATMGYSVGVVLAALIPDKAQAIMARAADYAFSREICGDHYQSDIEAAHALGTALGTMMLSNPALRPDIEAARTELLAALR
jgi:acid phosphatase (class A)